MNIEAAKQYADEVTAIMAQIDRSAAMLRQSCDGEELAMHLLRLAQVAASLQDDVLNPLFIEYPDTKPAGYVL